LASNLKPINTMSQKSDSILLPLYGKRKNTPKGNYELVPQIMPTHGLFKDETGKKYNCWTVIAYAGKIGKYQHRWLCRCDCGTQRPILSSPLRAGSSKSCGCLQKNGIGTCATHGEARGKRTKEWWTWRSIKNRCFNKNDDSYADYGGRGITVCERWKNSYTAFLEDMGRKPNLPRISIHRIDNNGSYEPGNCIWADDSIQANERRSNIKITIAGVTKNASQWADHFGVNRGTALRRLKQKWDPLDAVSLPPMKLKTKRVTSVA
jgi:hypothetical protein